VVADYTFDDIDESTSSGDRAVETTMHGGIVTSIRVPTIRDHDRHLVAALRELQERAALGDAAVLCPSKAEADGYQRILRKAGLETMSLESYDGTRSAACKVGTYMRVKGLDFKHVFIPRQELAVEKVRPDDASGRERTELARRRLYVAMIRARDSLWLGTVRSDALT
jgi:superfamily I DNA/RNA helicase